MNKEGRKERRKGRREKKGKGKKKAREGREEERGKGKEERTGKRGIKHNRIFLVLGIAKRIYLISKGYRYSFLTRWG